jgi:hypothetical protein
MFRCPKCQQELTDNARFCTYCGFNQTNARLNSIRAAQEALNASPATPSVPQTPPISGENRSGSTPPAQSQPKQNAPTASGNGRTPARPISPTRRPGQSVPRIPETPQPSKPDSLTGRYVSEQETRAEQAQSRPVVPHAPSRRVPVAAQKPLVARTPVTPRSPQPPDASPIRQTRQPRIMESSDQAYDWSLGLPDTLAGGLSSGYSDIDNKSLYATNKAAEQWHNSWRDRQHDEAGPAVNVSRGQASVPEPLLAMQHSILRMRAIVMPKNKESNFGFWTIIVMMLCLCAGLITYIVSTYLPGARLASQSISITSGPEPTLTFQQQDATLTTFKAGQVVHVQGAYFGAHDPIIFLLDTKTLNDTVTTDSHGSFDTALTIPATQLAGAYALQAQDNHLGQHAFLNFTVIASATSTTSLGLSSQGNPVSSLSFAAIAGKDNPSGKTIDLINNGTTPLSWSVAAVSDNNSGWLFISNKHTGGQLDPQQTDTIKVSVLIEGLNVTDKAHPYKGEIIFTVANQGQTVVPVELQIAETGVEVVISPNPIVAAPSTTTPGTCQNASLTLINLNNTIIDWTVKPSDDYNAQHIRVDGQTSESSTLQSSGSVGDTKVIQLTCIGVQLGKTYSLTVYYNGQTESIPVYISNQ